MKNLFRTGFVEKIIFGSIWEGERKLFLESLWGGQRHGFTGPGSEFTPNVIHVYQYPPMFYLKLYSKMSSNIYFL